MLIANAKRINKIKKDHSHYRRSELLVDNSNKKIANKFYMEFSDPVEYQIIRNKKKFTFAKQPTKVQYPLICKVNRDKGNLSSCSHVTQFIILHQFHDNRK